MTDITIPKEALEAAAKVLHDHAEIFDDVPWEDLSGADQEAYMDEARAACLAMLKNWPGAAENSSRLGEKLFVLPLPQKEPEA